MQNPVLKQFPAQALAHDFKTEMKINVPARQRIY
jgi:hypothetical protein